MRDAFSLIDLFARSRVASNLTMILMLMAGVWAITRLHVQLNPTRDTHEVNVTIVWRGASAEDVEKLITNPLEQQIKTLPGVKTLRSTTRNTVTNLSIELERDTDVGKEVDLIKQRVAQIRSFPVDIEPPRIAEQRQQELVASLLITGPDNVAELIPVARRMEKELIDEGIDFVNYQGLPTQEIAILVDSETLFELGMSFDQLAALLARQSQDAPGGVIGRGQVARQLRSLDQRRDSDGFNQVPVYNTLSGDLVNMSDIATVTRRPVVDQPQTSVTGEPAIVMNVMREMSTDAMFAADVLNHWFEETSAKLDNGISISLFREAWKYIRDELSLIIENGLSGLVLVILTLIVFLHTRVALWVMIGIPVSFLAALLGFYFTGGTINVLSLIGFVMALGIVVDDAIVVSEEALTQFQNGKSPADAATIGARRMFAPVVASSLTTLCAFLPLVMGETGIEEITLIMLWVIVASLVECFLVLPGHLRHAFANVKPTDPDSLRGRFNRAFENFRETRFRAIVRFAMRNRRIVIVGAAMMFALVMSMWISGWIKTKLSLSINFEYVSADVQFKGGVEDAQKDGFMREVERALVETNQENGGNQLVTFMTVDNQATVNSETKQGSQYASINVELVSPEKRDLTAEQFALLWEKNIPASALVDSIQVKKTASYWTDFTLLLKGDDVTRLKLAAEEFINELKKVNGVHNLHDDLPYGNEQWIFSLTTEGHALGLTTADLGRQLRAAYDGQRVQIFQDGDEELEVRLMLPERERTDLSTLAQFPIRTPGGAMLPLASVATWSGKRGIDIIRHHNVEKTIAISGDVDLSVITGSEVVTHAIDDIFPTLLDKYDLTYDLDRMSAEERDSMSEFFVSFIYALVLIYIVLVWMLSSYTWPLAVMAAIPLGLTGALGGHWILGMNIGPMSLLGMFALTGIVVNDSIILINTYKRMVEEGIPPQQAIEDAVCSRLRAVVLTSLTTVAGLFPLMLEQAPIAQIFTPLAAAICFGMSYGTALILLVVPASLSAMDTLGRRFSSFRSRDSAPALAAADPATH